MREQPTKQTNDEQSPVISNYPLSPLCVLAKHVSLSHGGSTDVMTMVVFQRGSYLVQSRIHRPMVPRHLHVGQQLLPLIAVHHTRDHGFWILGASVQTGNRILHRFRQQLISSIVAGLF